MDKKIIVPKVSLLNENDELAVINIIEKIFIEDKGCTNIFHDVYESMVFGISNEVLLGCAWYILNYKMDNFRTIYLNRLGILSKYQRQKHKNYGTTLLRESIKDLKDIRTHIEYISLYCDKQICPFYEQLGFEQFVLPIDISNPIGFKHMRLNRNNFNYKE